MQASVSPDEWQTRVELAACYRLVAHLGWNDGLGTHIAARVPGETDRLLLNPSDLMFHEITASCLVKVSMDGEILSETNHRVRSGGAAIHGAVLAARPELHASIHTHTEAGMAISMLDCELLPVTPLAMRFYKRLAYHDYFGQAGHFDDRELIAKDLGPHYAMIMKNHGLLTVGQDMGEAFVTMCALESAIRAQLKAMSTGARIIIPPQEVCDRASDKRETMNKRSFEEGWKGWMRLADSLDPSFRT
jgi:ribulose-5-phosphate 4-epimerase/fuculose-1-phosphate aldolase